jgi:hypothetical protein
MLVRVFVCLLTTLTTGTCRQLQPSRDGQHHNGCLASYAEQGQDRG